MHPISVLELSKIRSGCASIILSDVLVGYKQDGIALVKLWTRQAAVTLRRYELAASEIHPGICKHDVHGDDGASIVVLVVYKPAPRPVFVRLHSP